MVSIMVDSRSTLVQVDWIRLDQVSLNIKHKVIKIFKLPSPTPCFSLSSLNSISSTNKNKLCFYNPANRLINLNFKGMIVFLVEFQ